jgi:hypothetical protein
MAVGGGGANRRETRSRKVSQRMAIVDESTRKQVGLHLQQHALVTRQCSGIHLY